MSEYSQEYYSPAAVRALCDLRSLSHSVSLGKPGPASLAPSQPSQPARSWLANWLTKNQPKEPSLWLVHMGSFSRIIVVSRVALELNKAASLFTGRSRIAIAFFVAYSNADTISLHQPDSENHLRSAYCSPKYLRVDEPVPAPLGSCYGVLVLPYFAMRPSISTFPGCR